MLKHLTKHFGYTALGLCILIAAISLAGAIDANTKAMRNSQAAIIAASGCDLTMAQLMTPAITPKRKH